MVVRSRQDGKLTSPIPKEYQYVLFEELIPRRLEDVVTANKADYGDYTRSLAYVQEQLRKHQEHNSPIPMDIGSVRQTKTGQQEGQQEQRNEDHGIQYPPCDFEGSLWGSIDALGKGKGKGAKGDSRRCYHCGRLGHVEAEGFFKYVPWDQTHTGTKL